MTLELEPEPLTHSAVDRTRYSGSSVEGRMVVGLVYTGPKAPRLWQEAGMSAAQELHPLKTLGSTLTYGSGVDAWSAWFYGKSCRRGEEN